MSETRRFGVALFHSTQSAIRAEKALKEAGLEVKMIPTPRHLSSDCGLALRFLWAQVAEVEATLSRHNVELASIHGLSG